MTKRHENDPVESSDLPFLFPTVLGPVQHQVPRLALSAAPEELFPPHALLQQAGAHANREQWPGKIPLACDLCGINEGKKCTLINVGAFVT